MIEAEEEEAVDVAEDAEVAVVDVVRRTRSGSPSPSLAGSSRRRKSRAWRRSTCTLSQSKSMRF